LEMPNGRPIVQYYLIWGGRLPPLHLSGSAKNVEVLELS
jgi:hypothetical protein